jgi:hypothetical protein
MNEQDRQAIEGLFGRLAEAERQAGPMDAEADAFIKQRIGSQPAAPYMMAQTIVMQNYALEQAQQRIAELEEQAAEQPASQGGGMFGGIFGGGGRTSAPAGRGSVPSSGRPMGAPGSMPPMPMGQPQQQGGGFLAGAAQTAIGVAGGVMLGNALGGMFGGGSTATAAPAAPADAAAQQPAPAPEPAPEPEPVADEGGGGFFDSFFGGDGGDDI